MRQDKSHRTVWTVLIAVFVIYVLIYYFNTPSSLYDQPSRRLVTLSNRKDLHLIVLGDWGMSSPMQTLVARHLINFSQKTNPDFIVSVGDNFYSFGVKDIEDPLFAKVFEEKYVGDETYPEFAQIPWYLALGNHDCRGNKEAQVAYSQRSARWNMPSSYFSFSYAIDNALVHVIVLDTSNLACPDEKLVPLDQLLSDSEQYGECEALTLGDGGYQEFRDYADMQALYTYNSIERRKQMAWFESELERLRGPGLNHSQKPRNSETQWLFVVGHHGLYSASVVHGSNLLIRQDLEHLFDKYDVDVYFSGHDHTLQHIWNEGHKTHHFTSGGGAYMTSLGSVHFIEPHFPGLIYGEPTFGFLSVKATKHSASFEFLDFRGSFVYNTTLSPLRPSL